MVLTIKFFDTNALLKLQEKLLQETEKFFISSISLFELEHIKTDRNKDESTKFNARRVAQILNANPDRFNVITYNESVKEWVEHSDLEDTPDTRIIGCALYVQTTIVNNIIFVTDDICCNLLGKLCGLNVQPTELETDTKYTGFKELFLDEDELNKIYKDITDKVNSQDLMINEYLILYDKNNELVDAYRWTGEGYDEVYKKQVKSLSFGDKLKCKDIYQQIAVDSMLKNTITAISGKAGSGKSLLSLMVAMYLVDSGKYDRLVILYNPVKVRGAESQGYYPGSSVEKAMQSNIGQILTTKFGERTGVDFLISQDKIKLVCMADCRGMEIRDNEILYITECENTSIDLMKICLSRVSQGTKIFIEGDYEQIDGTHFLGNQNGMKRAIEVLTNEKEFGYVELQNVWRSRIAELADKF